MTSVEEFFFQQYGPGSPSAAFPARQGADPSALHEAVRQAANRGWRVFPISPLAKFTGRHELLICEAISDIPRLEELAAEYPLCDWRVAIGPSSLCIVQLDGQEGRESFASLSQDQGECLTLQTHRGDTAWAFFQWPRGLRASARKPPPGMRILGEDMSCIIPPSANCHYLNPAADVDAVPQWLRELAFEISDTPAGSAAPVPVIRPRPVPCRTTTHFSKPHRGVRKGYSVCDQAGWRRGFRVSRRR
jgi:hypothetical protein